MLVFAVAVLIREDVGRSMRLVSSLSERETDIAKILRDKFVEGRDFFLLCLLVPDQLLNFRSYFIVRDNPIALECGVPLANVLPTSEGG